MSKKALNTIIISTSLLISASAFAEPKFRPRVDVGLATYNLEIIDTTPGFESKDDLSTTYLKAVIGGSIINGRWYFDLGYSTSINAEADDSGETMDFTRTDLVLTAGYVFPSNVTIFGGYKSGKSEFSNFSQTPGVSVEFTADGIYGGAGINIPTNGNVVSLNAAIAILDGELVNNDPVNLNSFTADANTIGLSLAAGYSMPLSKTTGLAFKASYQGYNFDEYEVGGTANSGFSTNETILAFDVSYSAVF